MMKKAAAFTLAVLILSGVAYTSSYLSASRGLKEQARELQAKQEEREQEFLLPEKEGQEEKRQPAAVRPGAVKAEQKEPEQEGDQGGCRICAGGGIWLCEYLSWRPGNGL